MAKNCGSFQVEILFVQKTRKQEQEAKSREEVARNREILAGMLKASVSKEIGLSYAGAKKVCTKLKSSGDCHRTPGSGRKRKPRERSSIYSSAI